MAHTLTIGSYFRVLVNGTQVSSPYTLQDGDVITIQLPESAPILSYRASYGGNEYELSASNPPSLTAVDCDIELLAGGGGAS